MSGKRLPSAANSAMYGVDCWPTYMFPELSKTIERGFDSPVAKRRQWSPGGAELTDISVDIVGDVEVSVGVERASGRVRLVGVVLQRGHLIAGRRVKGVHRRVADRCEHFAGLEDGGGVGTGRPRGCEEYPDATENQGGGQCHRHPAPGGAPDVKPDVVSVHGVARGVAISR